MTAAIRPDDKTVIFPALTQAAGPERSLT